jgi:hypothetical protein
MSSVPCITPAPPWANRDLPRASLRLTRGGSNSATRMGHVSPCMKKSVLQFGVIRPLLRVSDSESK